MLARAQRPMIVVGAGALSGSQGAAVQAALNTIAANTRLVSPSWNGLNVLQLV